MVMMLLPPISPLLFGVLAAQSVAPRHELIAEVTAFERSEFLAFRLGKRIEDTLTLRRDGKTFVVRLATAHSGNGTPARYAVGERVMILSSSQSPVLTLRRDQVRRVQIRQIK